MATGTFKKCDDENFAYEAVLDITNPALSGNSHVVSGAFPENEKYHRPYRYP